MAGGNFWRQGGGREEAGRAGSASPRQGRSGSGLRVWRVGVWFGVSREMRRGEEVTAPCGMVVAGLVGRAGDQGDGSDGSVDEDGTAGGKFGGKGGHAGDSVCPPPPCSGQPARGGGRELDGQRTERRRRAAYRDQPCPNSSLVRDVAWSMMCRACCCRLSRVHLLCEGRGR